MSFLKRLLLAVLVFSTLGYSSAWAFDEHLMEQLDIETTSLSAVTSDVSHADAVSASQPHNQNELDVACDHSCHISSHLVAIFSEVRCQSATCTSIFLSNLTEKSHSFSVSPDLKPPRV